MILAANIQYSANIKVPGFSPSTFMFSQSVYLVIQTCSICFNDFFVPAKRFFLIAL